MDGEEEGGDAAGMKEGDRSGKVVEEEGQVRSTRLLLAGMQI